MLYCPPVSKRQEPDAGDISVPSSGPAPVFGTMPGGLGFGWGLLGVVLANGKVASPDELT